MSEIKVESLIISTRQRRGKGTACSPVRIITEVFDFDGEPVAEQDPCGGYTAETVLDFLKWKYKDIAEDVHIENVTDYFLRGEPE